MELIPVFKIGIINAWIFTASFLLVPILGWIINKEAYRKLGNPPDMKLSKREKVVVHIANIIGYAAFLYSIFTLTIINYLHFPVMAASIHCSGVP